MRTLMQCLKCDMFGTTDPAANDGDPCGNCGSADTKVWLRKEYKKTGKMDRVGMFWWLGQNLSVDCKAITKDRARIIMTQGWDPSEETKAVFFENLNEILEAYTQDVDDYHQAGGRPDNEFIGLSLFNLENAISEALIKGISKPQS